MKQTGITRNTDWDLVEQYFYEDVGLIYIDTEAVIKHLVKGKEDDEENRPEEKWDGPKLSC